MMFIVDQGTDSRMRCWSMATGKNTMINYADTKNHSKNPVEMAVSNNGQLVYHPNGNVINVYHIQSGELINTLQGHYEKINCCVFHPNAEVLVYFEFFNINILKLNSFLFYFLFFYEFTMIINFY